MEYVLQRLQFLGYGIKRAFLGASESSSFRNEDRHDGIDDSTRGQGGISARWIPIHANGGCLRRWLSELKSQTGSTATHVS